MLFHRQDFHHNLSGKVYLPELRTLENGSAEIVSVDQSENILPAVETTRLSRVLEAGIDLKRVPSKVLAGEAPKIAVASEDNPPSETQTQTQTQTSNEE